MSNMVLRDASASKNVWRAPLISQTKVNVCDPASLVSLTNLCYDKKDDALVTES